MPICPVFAGLITYTVAMKIKKKSINHIMSVSSIYNGVLNGQIQICDWTLEKRSKSHIRSFEMNGFKEFKPA